MGGRNSSIELLRIIAMFMILMHHFIVHNGYDVLKLPLGPERIFFQLVMQGGGKVGVVIFFSISAWFFLDREQTIKSNLRRVWIMERELLFWSFTLGFFYLAFDRTDSGVKLTIRSLAPLSTSVWWYDTSYAIFLALLPFLSKGLKALVREYHLALSTTVLVIWGLTSFVPGMVEISDGFLGFVYLFILISSYKWYLRPLSAKTDMGLHACQRGIHPALHGHLDRSGTVRYQQGNLHHWGLETPCDDDRLWHVPAVRPRHLPQPCHQPNRAIRVWRISNY